MSGNTAMLEAKTIKMKALQTTATQDKRKPHKKSQGRKNMYAQSKRAAQEAHELAAYAGNEGLRHKNLHESMQRVQMKQTLAREKVRGSEIKDFAEKKRVPGISVFALIGTLVISVLMVFVVLAQVNYNETASEAVRLSTHLRELTDMHRTLELAFESSIDLKEIERVARDELGMSRPDAAQIIAAPAAPRDVGMVVNEDEKQGMYGFAEFLKSLTNYFRRES